jgi:hypothetical protein
MFGLLLFAIVSPPIVMLLDAASIQESHPGGARAALKQAVDERGEGRAFGYDQDQAQGQQQNDDGREPPLFADAQEAPELSQDRKLSTHERNISAKA